MGRKHDYTSRWPSTDVASCNQPLQPRSSERNGFAWWLVVLIGVFGSISACVLSAGSRAEPHGEATQPVASSADEPRTQRAILLAREFLTREHQDWGEPSSVVEDLNVVELHYATPADEQRLLGDRVLLVDDRGNVAYRMRR